MTFWNVSSLCGDGDPNAVADMSCHFENGNEPQHVKINIGEKIVVKHRGRTQHNKKEKNSVLL